MRIAGGDVTCSHVKRGIPLGRPSLQWPPEGHRSVTDGPLVLFSRRFCLWWVTLRWATAVEAVRFGHGAPSVFVARRDCAAKHEQSATKGNEGDGVWSFGRGNSQP
jgi:hypothetical protein